MDPAGKEAPPPAIEAGEPAPAATDSVQGTPQPSGEDDDSRRWLFVEKFRQDKPGGWATGSFDPEKNKLIIQTHDVRQFAIETARIPIDWQRLVIISIDGRNSELRRRDYTRLRFVRDAAGQWIVAEP
jgi:hypothetical protein